MKISFVTTNKSKFEEVKSLFKEYGIELEWLNSKYEEDNEDAIEDTARKASQKLANELNMPVILEDTGLFFEAYQGFPGQSPKFVFKTLGHRGIFKLLDGESRKAYFKTCAAYCKPGSEPVLFSGEMRGDITTEIFNADKDFDFMPYDRIFIPEGETVTVSDMTMEKKNQLSQRSKAFRDVAAFLQK